MNRRDMVRAFGIFGAGMTVLPSLSYASEPTPISKWEPTGLLDGLSDKARTKMIVLLNNTERHIEEYLATDKHIAASDMEFIRHTYFTIARQSCEQFLDDDRFQTLKSPGGYASNGIVVCAKSQFSQASIEVPIGAGLRPYMYDNDFITNKFSIPIRNFIDIRIVNAYPNMVTYMYMPVVYVGLVYDPGKVDIKRYSTGVRCARLRNGPRESV